MSADTSNFPNGSIILSTHHLPFDVLLELFIRVDYKTLASCQLVCKYWREVILDYAWRRKAELALGRKLRVDVPWQDCYLVFDERQPFERNLIKNHSGKEKFAHWTLTSNRGDHWGVEKPPSGVPELPNDPVFEGKTHCFVTSYGPCEKEQVVDLRQDGFTEYVLDVVRPVIQVSEWHSCRWDCQAVYACSVELLGQQQEQVGGGAATTTTELPSSRKQYVNELNELNDNMNQWIKMTLELREYGPGLRKIRFKHFGQDRRFWAGRYGSKMAGACVKLLLPRSLYDDERDDKSEDTRDDTENSIDLMF